MSQSDRNTNHDLDLELGNSLSELERQMNVYRRRGFNKEAERLDGILRKMRGNRRSSRDGCFHSDNMSA